MKLVPKKVSKSAGTNPVARAIARNILRQAIVDQKIQLYMLEDGAPCAGICVMIAQMLSVLIEAAAIDKTVGTDNADVRVMRGAISACEQMIARVSPHAFNQAWSSKPRISG